MDKSKTLLIIEDDPDLRMTLEYFLGKIGYQVLAAKNCEEGLKVLQERHPRAVLCDIMLPGMDGYEACEKIKGDPATQNTAVIFISARDTLEVERKGAEVGADFYVPKPVDPNDVGADLYFLFDQDFHLSEENLRKLRVARKIPSHSEQTHQAPSHSHSAPTQFEEDFEFDQPDTGADAHHEVSHSSAPHRGMEDPITAESLENMNLSEVRQLLVSLRDSLKDTGQRLDAILQYIEVIED